MQIIWDETAAEKLRERHVVLELETFLVEGEERTVYCVVPVEKIGLNFNNVEATVNLHNEFIAAYRAQLGIDELMPKTAHGFRILLDANWMDQCLVDLAHELHVRSDRLPPSTLSIRPDIGCRALLHSRNINV